MLEIISRSAWGARAPTSKVTGDTITETYLHHTAGPHSGAAGMRSIQTFHMDGRGWSDIAYNFVIDPDMLTVYEGRGWGVRPGSQKSHNRGTWSVCVMGNFNIETPPAGLTGLIADLIVYGHELRQLPLELTGGHKDAPGQSTSCPGSKLHAQIPSIRNLLEDDMALTPEEERFVKDMYRSAVTERGSNGTFAGHTVDHLRKHPSGGGLTEAQVKEIINDAQIVAG